ncbi:ATP-binding protein [Gorillibacterium massiliense]|uniref:ATP-binding protein n=1 Tax=Gorillibacterium massiliense TaxID=1280390 RepID=UPI000594983C|nr:ATP-binding protein [Gorillibacterium massiliense]
MTYYIDQSWERCVLAGKDPRTIPQPIKTLRTEEMKEELLRYADVLSVIHLIGLKLLYRLQDTPLLLALVNQDGYVLEIFGHPEINHVMRKLGIREGVQMTEESMGTNAVYLAQLLKKPIEVVGKQHYHHALYDFAFYSVPFSFGEAYQLEGAVLMMNRLEDHSRFQLALLETMIDSMERELLVQHNNRNQSVVNRYLVHSGVILTDAEGFVVECNDLVEQIMGCKRADAIGQSVFDYELFGGYVKEVLEAGTIIEDLELTFNHSLAKQMVCLLDAMPLHNEEQELTGAFVQFRDITERKLFVQQTINSEKYSAIGKMAAGLAHEIRNPLTAVLGFNKLLIQKGIGKGEPEEQYLNIMYNELQSVSRLISDFVVMAKPGSPDRKICVLQEILHNTMFLMKSQAILKNTVIHQDYPEAPIQASIDPTQMKQVLMNLVQNAIDAMPEGGVVEVTLKSSENCLHIGISDNGIGMTEEELAQVLDPFFSTKENGLGLGLPVCYRIIQNHGGRLSVVSQKGIGTHIDVTLPTD